MTTTSQLTPEGLFCADDRISAAIVSSSTARFRAKRSDCSRRSISVIEVERISTFMLADSGIEFTEVPPRITPILNVVLGDIRDRSRRKRLNRLRQNHDGIGRAEIAPRVPARTAHDHFKAPAAKGLGDDGVGACAVEDQAIGDRIFPARRGKNMPHATQVAFALFPDVSDKNKW